jgi:hypothetical protein
MLVAKQVKALIQDLIQVLWPKNHKEARTRKPLHSAHRILISNQGLQLQFLMVGMLTLSGLILILKVKNTLPMKNKVQMKVASFICQLQFKRLN